MSRVAPILVAVVLCIPLVSGLRLIDDRRVVELENKRHEAIAAQQTAKCLAWAEARYKTTRTVERNTPAYVACQKFLLRGCYDVFAEYFGAEAEQMRLDRDPKCPF